MENNLTVRQANDLAKKIRSHVLWMTHRGRSSHIGSCLSVADIVASVYSIMNVDPTKPNHPDRDHFILSKGHAGAAVYAALAEKGFFPLDKLKTHYQNASTLSGHVSHIGNPGVDFSTGSLGHGLPVAAGISYARELDRHPARTFCVLSDGELDEGSNWEAFMFAGHHRLKNLIIIIDRNGLQSIKSTELTLSLEPLAEKLRSFRLDVIELDGHDHLSILRGITRESEMPKVLICKTVKGKGVPFMENNVKWHYSFPEKDDVEKGLKSLGCDL